MDAVDRLRKSIVEIGESALLGCLEPASISFRATDQLEVPRVRGSIRRAQRDRLARFRPPVNRNAFLLSCLQHTENRPEEHLVVGYGFRYGSTTKVESLHHAVGDSGAVHVSSAVAHAMWDYYGQRETNELLIFHNHPLNPLNLLLDNLPLPSQADRLLAEARALNPTQLVRTLLGRGRILFYLGENGFVKEFRWPSPVALWERHAHGTPQSSGLPTSSAPGARAGCS